MSLRDRMIGRSFAISLLALPLAGCLQPLYGEFSTTGTVASDMQSVMVDPLPDRLGHYITNELIFAFNGTGAPITPRYHLKIAVRESTATPLIDTVSGRASAGTILVNADYILTPTGTTKPFAQGTVFVAASYDRTSQRFADVRAARDAEIRDAKLLADQIRTRVAAVFAGQGGS